MNADNAAIGADNVAIGANLWQYVGQEQAIAIGQNAGQEHAIAIGQNAAPAFGRYQRIPADCVVYGNGAEATGPRQVVIGNGRIEYERVEVGGIDLLEMKRVVELLKAQTVPATKSAAKRAG